jgi:hypothetical protein
MSTVADDLEKIEEGTFKLQKEWDRFFAGQEKKAPFESRQRLDRLIRKYIGVEMRNNVERFRFQALTARYNTLSDMWNRRLRALEEGRPISGVRVSGRDLAAGTVLPSASATTAAEQSAEKLAVVKAEVRISTLREDEASVRSLYTQFQAARELTGEPALKIDTFRKLIAQHRVRLLEEKDAVAVDFRISTDGGKVSLKAKPIRAD